MTSTTFDTLGYFEKLKAAGVPEAQAKVQVETMQDVVRSYDETSRKDLATKGDIQDVRMEIQAVRVEMQAMENRVLRWMVGGFITQTALLVAILAFLR